MDEEDEDAAAAARKARLALPVARGPVVSSASKSASLASAIAVSAAATGSGSGGGGGGVIGALSAEAVLAAALKGGTRLTDSQEYRDAFLQALNAGLTGQAARDQVRSVLEQLVLIR